MKTEANDTVSKKHKIVFIKYTKFVKHNCITFVNFQSCTLPLSTFEQLLSQDEHKKKFRTALKWKT